MEGICVTVREQDPPLGVTKGDRSELCHDEILDDRGRLVTTVTTDRETGRLVLAASSWARVAIVRR